MSREADYLCTYYIAMDNDPGSGMEFGYWSKALKLVVEVVSRRDGIPC